MRVFNSVLISAFLVSIVSDVIFATPINSKDTCHPVVHKTCGTWCENNCKKLNAESLPCDWTTCRPGYYCKPGYVKELMDGYGRCILPSECPVKENTTISLVTEINENTTLVTETNENTNISLETVVNEDTTLSPITAKCSAS